MALLNNKIPQRPTEPADPWGGSPPRRAQFGRQREFQPPPLPLPPQPPQPPGGLLNNPMARTTKPKNLLAE